MFEQLINFLQSELAIPNNSIRLALKSGERDPTLLSIIFWQYGLLTLEQLERVFDWLEAFSTNTTVLTKKGALLPPPQSKLEA